MDSEADAVRAALEGTSSTPPPDATVSDLPAHELRGIVYSDSEVQGALSDLSRRAGHARLGANLAALLAICLAAYILLLQQQRPGLSFTFVYIVILLLRLLAETLTANFPRQRHEALPALGSSGLAERILCGGLRQDSIFACSPLLLRRFALGSEGAGLPADLARIGSELDWYTSPPSRHFPARLLLAATLLCLSIGGLLLAFFDEAWLGLLAGFFALLNLAGYLRGCQIGQQSLARLLAGKLPELRRLEREDPGGFAILLHYHSSSRLPLIINEILGKLRINVGFGPYAVLIASALSFGTYFTYVDPSILLRALPYLLTICGVLILLHLVMRPRLQRETARVGRQLEQSSILLEALSEQIGGNELRDALPPSLRWLKSTRRRAVSPRRSVIQELQETLRQVVPQLAWYTGERAQNLKPLYDLLTVLLLLSMLFVPPALAIGRLISVEAMGYMFCVALSFWGYIAWWQVRRQREFTKLLTEHILSLTGDGRESNPSAEVEAGG